MQTVLNNLVRNLHEPKISHKIHRHHTLKTKVPFISINFNQPPLMPQHKEILSLEKQILKFDDNKILNLCENTKAWHLLNSEKPTNRFCKLTRSLNKDASLTHIKKLDVNGEYRDYNNNYKLNMDLDDFYKDIYCKIPYKTLNLNNFLPDYIINQPEIQARKLNEQEYNEFNIPISLRELTEVLKQTKKNTSPGIDKFTYAALNFYGL